ncbi:MAG TPA: hypothetical protein VFG78_11615 [Gemmatimonadota bacterium]|nr:hypothetical protein [Gemmatimonadota bacterium]
MNHGLMEGMLWAGLLLVAVPLGVGIGVLVLLLRRRDGDHGGDLPAG